LNGGDYGDISIVPGYILSTYEKIVDELQPLIDSNIIPICLGGDHSITLAEMRALYKKHGKIAMVHFDSHCDINDLVFGEKYNHGTPFRRAIEEGLLDPQHSIQVGMRGSLYDPDEHNEAARLGLKVIPAHKIREIGFDRLISEIKERVQDMPVMLTFDIDFVDPAYAPGTGTPEVGGFTSWETLYILRNLSTLNFIGFDIVEVLPASDSSDITSYLAANICFEFISILALKKC